MKVVKLSNMSNFHPRSRLATHEVINQPEALGSVCLLNDPAMRETVENAFERLSRAGGVSNVEAAQQQIEHLKTFRTTNRQ